MPKDNRLVKRTVRIAGRYENHREIAAPQRFNAGQEDELAAAMSQEQLDRLVASGTLEGDWKSTQGAAPQGKAADKPADK